MSEGRPEGRPATPMLDRVLLPGDLKGLSVAELTQVAEELRAETISAVSVTGWPSRMSRRAKRCNPMAMRRTSRRLPRGSGSENA